MTGTACDIGVNNTLGYHNSLMLRIYALLDPTARRLGLFLKYWAKRRSINDPSAGSLSSYAYVILLIHYLQQERLLPYGD